MAKYRKPIDFKTAEANRERARVVSKIEDIIRDAYYSGVGEGRDNRDKDENDIEGVNIFIEESAIRIWDLTHDEDERFMRF